MQSFSIYWTIIIEQIEPFEPNDTIVTQNKCMSINHTK